MHLYPLTINEDMMERNSEDVAQEESLRLVSFSTKLLGKYVIPEASVTSITFRRMLSLGVWGLIE
jgi:hypothetical protein